MVGVGLETVKQIETPAQPAQLRRVPEVVRVVLLGPPGAGKGTQAQVIAEPLGVPAISTGDIFRANVSGQTELGRAGQGLHGRRRPGAGRDHRGDGQGPPGRARRQGRASCSTASRAPSPRPSSCATSLAELGQRARRRARARRRRRGAASRRLSGRRTLRRRRRLGSSATTTSPRRSGTGCRSTGNRPRRCRASTSRQGLLAAHRRHRRGRRGHRAGAWSALRATPSGRLAERRAARWRRAPARVPLLAKWSGRMIQIKTPHEIELMRAPGSSPPAPWPRSGRRSRPGVSTGDSTPRRAHDPRRTAPCPTSSGYHGFTGTICASINDEVVHGIPCPSGGSPRATSSRSTAARSSRAGTATPP